MKTRKFATVVEETENDEGPIYRLMTWYDDSEPRFEFYVAEFSYEDDGDAESGPHLSCSLESWTCIGIGIGHTDMAEMIARHEEEKRNA